MQTENSRQTLERIVHNNTRLNSNGIKQVLILHEEELTNIGDWVIRFDNLKYLKGFLPNAAITINFTAPGAGIMANALLKNNPHLQAVTTKQWQEINFESFDFIVSVSYNEQAVLSYLHQQYGSRIQSGQFNLCMFTMSHYMIKQREGVKPLFPINMELSRYAEKMRTPVELFLSAEEQQWADEWLREKGLQDHEQLFIILDATTNREKMLSVPVYFEWLSGILKREHVKVLNYDEMNIGKEEFYRQVLSPQFMQKIIFSKGLSLREAICLLGASRVKLVFGPCTGLMHCASGIYNNRVSNGLEKTKAPVLVTYTGRYLPSEGNVYLWWNNAPLMNVLVLRNRNNLKKMMLMNELNDVEKITNDELPCTGYTAAMLAEFVAQQLPEPRAQLV